MQQRVTSGLTPLPPLQIASSSGPSAGSTAPPGPSASSSQACPEIAQKAPHSQAGKAQLAAATQKRGRGGDPRASVWKIHLHPARLSGENDLINLIPPIAVTRNTKTRLRTPMTPTNPLTGLSRVLPHLPWPPAPLVTPLRHPSGRARRVSFHSTCLCTRADTSSSYIVGHFISLNARLITLSHGKSMASDYGSSDSP